MSEAANEFRPRCKHLCCKSMMVYGENFQDDPEFQSGLVDFWCVLTSRGIGPDDEHVALDACSVPERTCYQEY
jgi:hypothetical protein